MKHKIIDNLQYLREDEIQRLKIELFKEQDKEEVGKFYDFIKLMDKGRNVYIGKYLPEWKPYFDGKKV
jgi:hypothetical protein